MASCTVTCPVCRGDVVVEFDIQVGNSRPADGAGIILDITPTVRDLDATVAEHCKLHVEPIG